ncbi:gastrin/cholecystokinin type B receptor-like protein [Dinothrombium tinctorium]|uniref:Gastrin/cholecystokinin type B receptor-like protein n=1 Tax=Dinothrombium tinctorium TaxID=1965070 RepID=A0A3S3NWL1_9ACAR|nr:gastrin/cholecystokinin type B receptor-like protein [Dinothrombium tinctorium]RWS00144.1 gastrin/cholecystokinin type B receptor-like protein [Dinothrombium tinctorium]
MPEYTNSSDNVANAEDNKANETGAILPMAEKSDYDFLTLETILTMILPYVCIFILAVVGNILVIITLAVNRRMRSVTNAFLINLAVSDLLLGVFCMPFSLIGLLMKQFIFGSIMCRLVPYFQGT